MTSPAVSLIDRLSRLLEPRERDGVLGDLAECGASRLQTVRELLGLLARRQAMLWKHWQPWFALLALAVPLGIRLASFLLVLSVPVEFHLRTFYAHGVPYSTGLTSLEESGFLACQAMALFIWSWTTGFALGSLSGQTLWLTGSVYFFSLLHPLLSLFSFALAGPARLPRVALYIAPELILGVTLFLLPSLAGMRRGRRMRSLTVTQAAGLTAVVVLFIALSTWTGGWPYAALERWSGGTWDASAGWENRLSKFVVLSLPLGYLLASAIRRTQPPAIPL